MSMASTSQARTAWVIRCNGSRYAAEASSISRNGSALHAAVSFNVRKLSQMADTCAIGDLSQTAYSPYITNIAIAAIATLRKVTTCPQNIIIVLDRPQMKMRVIPNDCTSCYFIAILRHLEVCDQG